MLYYLIELSDKISAFNVFRYITFRTGGAMLTAGAFVFMFGPWIIDHLRVKQGKGQPIRPDGPQSHIVTKKGTPTMGGLMILLGIVVATVLWANPANYYVWTVLGVTLTFGAIGFYDDYLKVTKQSHDGFSGTPALPDRNRGRGRRLLCHRAAWSRAVRDLDCFSILQGLSPRRSVGSSSPSAPSSSSAPAMR